MSVDGGRAARLRKTYGRDETVDMGADFEVDGVRDAVWPFHVDESRKRRPLAGLSSKWRGQVIREVDIPPSRVRVERVSTRPSSNRVNGRDPLTKSYRHCYHLSLPDKPSTVAPQKAEVTRYYRDLILQPRIPHPTFLYTSTTQHNGKLTLSHAGIERRASSTQL